jgi:hypothetical protein
MAQLRTAAIIMPGSYGLNLEDGILIDQAKRFVSEATNGVVDVEGRLRSRSYFVNQSSGVTSNLLSIAVYRHTDAVETVVTGTDAAIYTGVSTLTSRKSNAATGNYKFVGGNGKLLAFCAGETPMIFNGGTFAEEAFTGAPWTSHPAEVIIAYGRAWAADDATAGERATLWFSGLLTPAIWNAGDAGEIDLSNVWVGGGDVIVALAALSNRMYIFGQTQIVQYTMPEDNDPASMSLGDVATIGAVARDAVLTTEQGIYFLSKTGVYRIDKAGQITALMAFPAQSKLVNGDLLSELAAETLAEVRMGYHAKEGWVLLTFPTSAVTYCINTRRNVEGVNVPVITKWTHTDVAQRGFASDSSGNLYCAGPNGVHKYTGDTPGSNSITFSFMTQWLGDGGEESDLKALSLVLDAASGQAGTARWRTDFKEGTTYTQAFTCTAAEFAEDPGIGEAIADLTESGGTVKLGASFVINGDPVAVHALRLYSTGGALKF